MNRNDIHSQQVSFQIPQQLKRVAQQNAFPQPFKNNIGQRQSETMQNQKPQQYNNAYNPLPVQDVQRARGCFSQYDTQQRKGNIKFIGSVPKYQEQDQGQQGQVQNYAPQPPSKIKIIKISESKAMNQVQIHQNQQDVRQQRGISQEPIQLKQNIRILNPQQNYYKQATPPQFKNQNNQQYLTNNQQQAFNPINQRNDMIGNSIRQKQEEIKLVPKKTPMSVMDTMLATFVTQKCFNCQQAISSDVMMLSCQHCFHENCFYQLIKTQSDNTNIFCNCKNKIKLGPFRKNENMKLVIDKILENQIEVIKKNNIFQSCQRCGFFWVKGEQISVCQCN